MTLHCVTRGEGPDLVLLHGWGADSGVWGDLAEALARRFRVHLVDLPGYGGSPPCEPYSLARFAELLSLTLPPRCFVCAWSLGGQAALAWAGIAPMQVARLALVATTPCFCTRPGWSQALDTSVLEKFAYSLAADRVGVLRRFLLLQARGDTRARQVVWKLQAALASCGRPHTGVLEHGLRILMESDLRELLGAIAQPVLVMHGERDSLVPLGATRHLSAALPRARLAVIGGAAHAPFLSAPLKAAALLEGHFGER